MTQKSNCIPFLSRFSTSPSISDVRGKRTDECAEVSIVYCSNLVRGIFYLRAKLYSHVVSIFISVSCEILRAFNESLVILRTQDDISQSLKLLKVWCQK